MTWKTCALRLMYDVGVMTVPAGRYAFHVVTVVSLFTRNSTVDVCSRYPETATGTPNGPGIHVPYTSWVAGPTDCTVSG